ncbi:MAG: hypothetical protein A2451_03995 [Bdellovibrionales bacterium RIFOXYC2_FULL_39_8]|nr:MAG: hypothetical protein A2451_03995 [Bdellovibrionales bacterium RIFOXYC2_FULL_39_8]
MVELASKALASRYDLKYRQKVGIIKKCIKRLDFISTKGLEIFSSFVKVSTSDSYEMEKEGVNKELRSFIGRVSLYRDVEGKDHNHLIYIDNENKCQGRLELSTILQVLTSNEERQNLKQNRICTCHFEFSPHKKNFFGLSASYLPVFNTYQPPEWRKDEYYCGTRLPVEEKCPEIYVVFFEHLLNGNKESIDFLILWMAFSLIGRNPTMLVAVGAKGVGKTLLFEMILRLLHGVGNSVAARDQFFKSQFNSQISGCTLIYFDEIFIPQNAKNEINRLKLIANEFIEVEAKGVSATNIRNYANVYITSNHYNGIPLEKDDRRLSILEITNTKIIDNPELKTRINELSDPDNISKLGRYLLGLNVTREQVEKNLVSVTNSLIEEANLAEWESWVINEWVVQNRHLSNITIKNFQDDCRMRFPDLTPPGHTKLENLSKKYPGNFILKKRPSSCGGDRYFEFPPPES